MAEKSLVIIGGGGHGLVVGEAARLASFMVAGFYDDDPGAVLRTTGGLTHLGAIAGAPGGHDWTLGLGDISLRRTVLLRVNTGRGVTVVHPWAFVAPTARIGAGVYIGPGAVVHSFATVGDHAIINSGAIVEHECTVGENSHIAPGAVLGGRVQVGLDTLIGLGSRVLPGVTIGRECTVGAGAVVTRSLHDGTTVRGVPARAPEAL
jgi:sugar O-acyltransferase (sialic acid O-acetyltransferase NeuD family)